LLGNVPLGLYLKMNLDPLRVFLCNLQPLAEIVQRQLV
jgi:hypothetical protein